MAQPEPTDIDIFQTWLGDPNVIGADSWLDGLFALAAAIAAVIAIVQLRKNVLQARATFLLQLEYQWDNLKDQRKYFQTIRDSIRGKVFEDFADKTDKKREEELRRAFTFYLRELKKREPASFVDLAEYLNFFETLGLMIRRRYLPFKDLYLLYKGPLLEIERGFSDFIRDWQQEAHMPPGLYENLIFATRKARLRDEREQRLKVLIFWRRVN